MKLVGEPDAGNPQVRFDERECGNGAWWRTLGHRQPKGSATDQASTYTTAPPLDSTHHDETIRGHVFCSFLALVLRKELQDRLTAAGYSPEWADVLRDLEALQWVEVEHQAKRFRMRSQARGVCSQVFQAVGVAFPPTLEQRMD